MIATAPIPTHANATGSTDEAAFTRHVIERAAARPNVTEMDARSRTTPPHPRVAILTALRANPPGHPQFVRTSAAPDALLRELEPRGVFAYPTQLSDGSWRTLFLLKPQNG